MKDNKMIILFCIVAALFFFVLGQSYASEYHHAYIGQSSTPSNTVVNTQNGVALGIAMSQLGFDWGTSSYQAGVSVGSFDTNDAISIGLGKRVDRVLLNGSIGREGNKYGYGFGLRFHF